MQLPDGVIASRIHSKKAKLPREQLMIGSILLNALLLLVLFSSPDSTQTPATQTFSIPQNPSCPTKNSTAPHYRIPENSHNSPVNLDHGDPTMFEAYWIGNRDTCATVLLSWEQMSYFASRKHFIWFVENELDTQIRELHSLVGNAVTEHRSIVVGTGSTQLFQAVLYAISPHEANEPAQVVSATPYYSSYPVLTDYLKSGIHKWAGDAVNYKPADNQFYIELVTSPNNPDGTIRSKVVDGNGPVVYDLAYYWPHYTPITEAANHDIMLFTVSKCTGHAGSRIGWAIVKDPEVARRMTKFIELNTIGVSHDSQLRAAEVLKSIVRGYHGSSRARTLGERKCVNQLFHFGYLEMSRRWDRLRKAIGSSSRFSLAQFSPSFCSFFGQVTSSHPAFAWLKCNKEDNCKQVLENGGIISRCGSQFGTSTSYVRISMLDREHNFQAFISRISALASSPSTVLEL